jgi:thiol-disulfide isomerase/thioredoxin
MVDEFTGCRSAGSEEVNSLPVSLHRLHGSSMEDRMPSPSHSFPEHPPPERDNRGSRAGLQRWIGLGLALLIVSGALVVARPDRDTSSDELGIVEQVESAADTAELQTGPEPGMLAPNFYLESLEGERLRLSDLRGRPLFLNFWATWCTACITEMPAMQELADRYGDDLTIVGINVDQPRDEALDFAVKAEIRYPLLLDPGAEVTRSYQVRSMPTSLFIAPNGVVHSVRFGPLTETEMEQYLAEMQAIPHHQSADQRDEP